MSSKQKYTVSAKNLDTFFELNDALRELTAHSEAQFFSQFTDISMMQAQIILSINYHQPCKMSQIAKTSRLTLGSVTQLVDKLETKAYVKRVRSKSDRRVIFVELTKKGLQVVSANKQHVQLVGKNIMSKFNKKEQALFLEFFTRMASE